MFVRRAAAVLLALLSSPLAAEPSGSGGTLRSIACGKLAPPHRFEVSLQDDGPSYARLEQKLAAELQRRRVEVAETAPLRLSLAIDTVRTSSRPRRPDLGSFRHDTDRGSRLELNVWSNQHDSLIGGRLEGAARRSVDELHVEIAINDKSNGRCVWQGEAIVDLDGRDANQVALSVIPLLVAHIGETVRSEAITLD